VNWSKFFLMNIKFASLILALFLITSCGDTSTSSDKRNKEGILIDPTTNLMWQDNTNVQFYSYSWHKSVDYCGRLSLGGFQDWRLPSLPTLKHIYTQRNIFNFKSSKSFWSSSSNSSYSSYAWYINFDLGNTSRSYKTSELSFRCVRG